jgi:hypothetical protein
MTISKKRTKNATAAPPTKARDAKRSAKVAPLKAEPAPKAAGAKKPVTAPRGGSKTDKILNLLKRPGGVTLTELVKATAWQPDAGRVLKKRRRRALLPPFLRVTSHAPSPAGLPRPGVTVAILSAAGPSSPAALVARTESPPAGRQTNPAGRPGYPALG